MSEMSIFALSKLSALTEQIRKDLSAYHLSTYAFNNSFVVNISFEEFDGDLKNINKKVDEITIYFGLDRDNCNIEIKPSLYRTSISITDLKTQIQINLFND